MGTRPGTSLPLVSPPMRWVRWLRLATLVAALLIVVRSVGLELTVDLLGSLLLSFPFPWTPLARWAQMFLLLGAPVLALYAFICWRLRAGPDKLGLRLAFAAGFVGFVLAAVTVEDREMLWSTPGWLASVWLAFQALLVLAQATMVVSALAASYTLGRAEGAALPRVWQTVNPLVYGTIALVGFVLAGFILHYLVLRPPPYAANEASAVDSLVTINTAAVHYRLEFSNGFPSSLQALGPPPPGSQPSCRAADFIDAGLVAGRRSGYVFEYTPGRPVSEPPAGCPPGVESYTVSARPLRYKETGQRSFFTDKSRTICWTADDRAASVKDEPLQ